MKKFYALFAAVIAVALLAGCKTAPASGPATPQVNAPQWSFELPGDDEFWGIGIAKLQNPSLGMSTAESRARASVASQVKILIQGMLIDYQKESGTLQNSVSIQSIESINRSIQNMELTGAVINKREQMPDGTWWARVALKKADAKKQTDDVFTSEAARYADFKAAEASRMLDAKLKELEPQKPIISE